MPVANYHIHVADITPVDMRTALSMGEPLLLQGFDYGFAETEAAVDSIHTTLHTALALALDE